MKSLLERLETQGQFQHEYVRQNGVVKAGSNHRTGDQMRSWIKKAETVLSQPPQPQPATIATPQLSQPDSARIPSPADTSPQPLRNPSSFTNASDIIEEKGRPQPRNLDRNLKVATKSIDAAKIDAVAGKPKGTREDWLRAYFLEKKNPTQISYDPILNPGKKSRQYISRIINEWKSNHPEGYK